MSERSRQFRRVSTKKQEQEKQLADLAGWDASHKYDAGTPYVVDGKSAFHGKQEPELKRAVEELEAGDYEVLSFWKADRMWRGESLAKVLTYVERIHNAGGRIEFVKDSHLNITPDSSVPAWVRNMLFAQAFGVANAESQNKSDRSKMDIEYHKEVGSVHGRSPWGMAIECLICLSITKCQHKDNKRLVYTPEGRKWIPLIFQAVIDGKSLRAIARWLDAEGVRTMSGKPWNEYYIGNHVIKNPTYYGKRPNAGNLEVEAIVTPTVWQQASESLNSRYRPGRSTTKQEKALLKPVCGACYKQKRDGCLSGKSPMYRIFSQYGSKGPGYYYRCAGQGPQRKGCGAPMIAVDELDMTVTDAMLEDNSSHIERVFVPGDNRADQIAGLRESGVGAMRKGDYAAATAAMQQAAELEAMPVVRPHWERKFTDQTEGDYFGSLDAAAQREYLSKHEITAQAGDEDMPPLVSIVAVDFT